jgi:predicted phage replisome organizer
LGIRDKEKYYWLKLGRNFFKRHDIRIIEDMPDGKEYVLFYLKLMVEAIDHEGALRFSDTIPYSESMLSSVTNTDAEVVRNALELFKKLGIVEMMDDETLFLREVAKLLDCETFATKRKREQKERKEIWENFPQHRGNFPIEKEIDKDTEKESDSDIEYSTEPEGSVCRTKDIRRIQKAWNELGLKQIVKIPSASKRGVMLKARIREYGVESVLEAIGKVKDSPFLKGQNARSWVITFDWLIKPNNFIKVLEGNYDDEGKGAGGQPGRTFVPSEL